MKLLHVPAQRCTRTLKPGMAKRMLARGPLHGYTIACPGCGFTALHMTSEATFVETGKTTREGPLATGRMVAVEQPESLSIEGSLQCPACRGRILIRDNLVTVEGAVS